MGWEYKAKTRSGRNERYFAQQWSFRIFTCKDADVNPRQALLCGPQNMPPVRSSTIELTDPAFLFFQILLWDTRLLPALSVENTENATLESTLWEDLPMSARRALVATVRLPSYAACARQLQLENLKMWAALDADWGASVLSR